MLASAQTTGKTTTRHKARPVAVFAPLPWQIPAWRDKSLTLLLTGSAGGGKSRLAAEKVHGFCLRYPGAVCLIARKAREWNSKSILPFFAQTVVGKDPAVTFHKSEGTFYYRNGSMVYSGGMMDDSQREAIRSIGGAGGLDLVWLEEANAFSRQDYEEALGRMRHNAGGWRQMILTTNPGGSSHWIYKDLIKAGGAAVYYSGARDNPYNPADYLATLDTMTGVMRKRLVEGLWVQAEGAVFDTFDHATHVKARPESEIKAWALAMDEGYTNPAVILLVGRDSDGRWHVAREFHKRGVLQGTVVKTAREWCMAYNCGMVAVDAAAAGLVADLRDAGLPAVSAKGRVLDGIQTLQDMLKVQGDGRPRLTIDPACVNLIGEMESYAWRRTSAGVSKDEPEKMFDHGPDALRYLSTVWIEWSLLSW